MAITKVINDAVDLNQTSDYSGLRLPVGTTGDIIESFTTDYLVVGGGGGSGTISGAGGAGGLRTSYNNSTTTTNSLSFPSGKTAVATYMLNNNANDVSGNYNGTETNITYNTGKYGGAAVFNGSSSYIDLNHNTTYSDLTISAWVNVTSTSSRQMIVGKWWDGSNRSVAFMMDSGGVLKLLTSSTGADTVITTGGTLTANTWHFVCFTFQNGGDVTITLDSSTTTTTQNTSINNNNQNWLIGMEDYRGGDKWNGSIDQVRMYNTALDSTDVSNIYNNEAQANSGGGAVAESSLTLTEGVAYDVTVGAGGAAVNLTGGNNGGNSIFSTITSLGGGFGGLYDGSAYVVPGNGGSGGGGSLTNSLTRGNGTLNQGYEGGYGDNSGPPYSTGGGGGTASPGQNSPGGNTGGTGGAGLEVNIIGGSGNYYAGGGGGAGETTGASGGIGGGGDGSGGINGGEDGAFNTGGGAGGWRSGGIGFNGGSGVVILRYPTASVSSFTTTGTLNTPSTTDTLASAAYPTTNTAYYKLDGNATDSSSNGYNGTASNVTWRNGRYGQAAVFNGSSSIITATQPSGLNGPCTYSAWLKTTSSSYQSIITVGSVTGSHTAGVNLFVNSGKLSCQTGNGSSTENSTVNSTSDIDTGNWVHCAVVVAGSTQGSSIKVYVNGQEEGSGTADNTAIVAASSESLCLGGRILSGSQSTFLNGSLDQVRIYSSALTSSQVTQLYNEHYQTKFTDGSDTIIIFTEGTGTVTFSGVDPAPPQGALRTNTSYSEDGSASVIEHYNGTDWKRFDAIKYCTTNTLNFPSGAGCIASYNLDNNVNDIGNTYNGVNSNVTFTASGKFGAAAVFNGSNSRIDISNVLSGFTDTYSFSIWAKINNTNNFPFFASDPTSLASTNNMRFALHQNGNYYFDFGNNSTARMTGTTPSAWRNNNWHHFVFVSTPTQKFAYVDGSLFNTLSSTTAISGKSSLTVGHYLTNYGQGDYDQIRIFNDSLTSDEVSKLYNNEIACS